ncbi:MAG: hypothetical protein KBD27_00680 [Candidatus Moranbacteria bacterium]|nr:hypothetical protein [Candidatus Moranbacteria bacterium]
MTSRICALVLIIMFCAEAQADQLSLTISIPYTGGALNAVLQSGLPERDNENDQTLSPCAGGIATVIYTHASHPGGRHHGWPNEDTGGRGNRCYLDKEQEWYVLVGGLENSQYRETFVLGPGFRQEILNVQGFSLSLGGELPFVNYELYGGGAVRGFLPVIYAEVGYRLNKSIKVGLMHMWLPKGGVTLRGTVLDTALHSQAQMMPLSSLPSRGGSQPALTLVLNYQF